MDAPIEKEVFYLSRDAPIKCLTLPDGRQLLCLYDILTALLKASNATLSLQRFKRNNPHFKTETYQFQGAGRHGTPVTEGRNVIIFLMRIRLNKEQENDPTDIRGQFMTWILAVLAGDSA
jgi:hypothetical protein